jgi:putative Ca2+/H+ antiporter (TMEM165/GDT1 family)
MDITVFFSAFLLLFLAELGDKTQLATMMLAHRYPVKPVIAGAFLAFGLLNALAVLVGKSLFRFVPQEMVLIAAGGLFLVFAYRSWREALEEEAVQDIKSERSSAFMASFSLIFLAELGDKTQLAIIALSAGTGDAWAVFVGGTLALWSVTLLGALLGSTLLRRFPKKWMHRTAAVLFLLFGLLAIGQVVNAGL